MNKLYLYVINAYRIMFYVVIAGLFDCVISVLSQIFMAGNGSVINTIRLACLGKSNGQPFSLSLEGLFFHAPYSVSNQSNKPVGNLEMCEIRVNTHTF